MDTPKLTTPCSIPNSVLSPTNEDTTLIRMHCFGLRVSILDFHLLTIMFLISTWPGVLALYRGLLPTVVRCFPACGALFITYEYTRLLFTPKSAQYSPEWPSYISVTIIIILSDSLYTLTMQHRHLRIKKGRPVVMVLKLFLTAIIQWVESSLRNIEGSPPKHKDQTINN